MIRTSPLIRWIDRLLYGMAQRSTGPVRILRSQPLPHWPEHDLWPSGIEDLTDAVPVDFDHIANRLKVLSQLNPGPYKQPVNGKMNIAIQLNDGELHGYCCYMEFDDTAADPYFVLTMVEESQDAGKP